MVNKDRADLVRVHDDSFVLVHRRVFITGSTFLYDSGATSSCFYDDLRPTE